VGIDYQQITKDFKEGDIVQRYFPAYVAMSPFVGRVTAVHRGTGFCDVQWPHGNERVSSDELVRTNPELVRYLPSSLDTSFQTIEVMKARKAAVQGIWRTVEVPPSFHREVAYLWSKGLNEVQAYDEVWKRHASMYSDEVLRDEVLKFYRVARNLVELRIQSALNTKAAAYWVAQNRQYRVSQQEAASRKPACPRCGTGMRRATYKMHEGNRVRLFACPKDLFLIKEEHLLGPTGSPVVW
jgi:ribosomal protein S27AE